MGFRIMQLHYEVVNDKGDLVPNIVDGYEMWLSNLYPNYYGTGGDGIKISSWYTPEKKRIVKSCSNYDVEELGDGFKEIILSMPSTMKVEEEEAIILLVNSAHSVIKTARYNSRIAGRFPEVGVFILEPNEKIAMKRYDGMEEYVALQFEKKMYLVKIHD